MVSEGRLKDESGNLAQYTSSGMNGENKCVQYFGLKT